ncbi:MAG: DUF4348 domain-containing protein [Bacteroidales bacterium]|nr:DUF4348 domain-containing protein [Bacteroidales bacterium]
MRILNNFLSLALITAITWSMMTGCNSARKSTKEKKVEDFDIFYDKFHSDEQFQLSRIKFPLEGLSVDGIEEAQWSKDNWVIMKTRIYDIDTTQYKIFYKKTEKDFTQKVWIEDSGFSSECRFELIDNTWFLVFMMDQNL